MKRNSRVMLILCLPALLTAGAVFAAGGELPAGRDSATASYLAMRAIPRAVYADQPDSLLTWLNAWEEAGGPAEPIMRLRILGAIWDGAFSEDLYGQGIIDLLLQFCGVKDSWDAGRRDEAFLRARNDFETFSRAFADQLLPHVTRESPEEFFCLMYSGRRDQAWRLLASDPLQGTLLRAYRDRRLRQLEEVLPVFIAAEGGYWSAFNRYVFAGDHALTGLQAGVRKGPWFARLVAEVRLGRAERGYLARQGDILGVSDRFNAVLIGLELGRAWPVWKAISLEGCGGIGLDGVKPLREEDVFLNALHLGLGGGLHLDLGRARRWFVAVTGRREWVRPRNTEGTALWGDAWSVRLAVGVNLKASATREVRLLKP